MRRRAASLVKEIRKLHTALKAAHRSLARLSRHVAAARANPGGNDRSRPRLSSEVRASMVLQGRYMGYMRQLKPRQKSRVRRIREVQGVRAAIVGARELAGK